MKSLDGLDGGIRCFSEHTHAVQTSRARSRDGTPKQGDPSHSPATKNQTWFMDRDLGFVGSRQVRYRLSVPSVSKVTGPRQLRHAVIKSDIAQHHPQRDHGAITFLEHAAALQRQNEHDTCRNQPKWSYGGVAYLFDNRYGLWRLSPVWSAE
jgi:hypothetical protein